MRIKKPITQEEINKTFANIALRDAAKETLSDGDIIKVLDASDDPLIPSGWAIYRYSKESDLFDLIEQELQAVVQALQVDGLTTVQFEGGIISAIGDLDLFNNFSIAEKGDFYLSGAGGGSNPYLVVKSKTNNTGWFNRMSAKTGTKDIVIKMGQQQLTCAGFNPDAEYGTWLISYLVGEADDMNNPSNMGQFIPTGEAPISLFNTKNINVSTNSRIPAVLVRAKLPKNGEDWDASKIQILCLLNKYFKEEEEEAQTIEIDNKTIVEDSAKKLVSFHSLNQGLGFEFPEPTALNVDFSNPAFMKIHWLNHKTGVDVFKYKGVEYKLGLRDHTYSTAGVKTNCDTLGFTHYARVSAYLGYTYYGARCEMFAELPDLSPFVYSTKEYLPIGVIKLVFNPDYTLNLVETQISEIYKKGILIREVSEVVAAEKWDLDNQTVCETTYAEKQVLFNPSSLQTHRANFTILEDFGLKFSVGKTITGSKTFLLVEPDGGKCFIPVMSNGVKKYMNLQGEHVLMNDIFGATFAGNWKYFTLRAIITDTTVDIIKNLGTSYENTGEPMQVFPYPLENQYYFVQIGVKFNADGETIDDMRNIKIMPYWKQALDLGAIPTFDANTIDRSQVSEFSNQFSVPEAMHGFRQDQIVLKDFDFDFSHDKDTKLITMSVRGGGFKAIPILVGGVRKYIHLQECTFDMSNFGFGFNRFHFAVSAPVRDTAVYSTNGMTNQYNGVNGGVANVKPSAFDSVTIFQVSGTVPAWGTKLENHAFSVHKYWKKALAPFDDLYTEMMP